MEEKNKNVKETTKKQLGGITGKGFMPGQSGNPAGRPPGTYSLLTILKNKLSEIHPDQKKEYGILLVESMLDDALMLDGPSRKLVMQYIEGLPQQKMELTHILPKPLDDIPKDNSLQEDKGYEEENKSITGGDSSLENSIDSNLPNS